MEVSTPLRSGSIPILEVTPSPLKAKPSLSLEYKESPKLGKVKTLPVLRTPTSLKPRETVLTAEANGVITPLKSFADIIERGYFSPAINKTASYPYETSSEAPSNIDKTFLMKSALSPDKDAKDLIRNFPLEEGAQEAISYANFVFQKLQEREQQQKLIDSQIDYMLRDLESQLNRKEEIKQNLIVKLEEQEQEKREIDKLEEAVFDSQVPFQATQDKAVQLKEEILSLTSQLKRKKEEEMKYAKLVKYIQFVSTFMLLFVLVLYGVVWVMLWQKSACTFPQIGNYLWNSLLGGLSTLERISLHGTCFPNIKPGIVPT